MALAGPPLRVHVVATSPAQGERVIQSIPIKELSIT
jgi:hypothetical protein